jgi:hypothetical protein
MVTKEVAAPVVPMRGLAAVITAYVVAALATVAVLAVLAAVAPSQAPDEAWGHAIVVAVFAVVLPLRLRAARRGSATARRAVAIICTVLVVVNAVEAVVPAGFPTWMRLEMVVLAVLMASAVLLLTRLKTTS